MSDEKKLISLLGIAKKAGRVVSGTDMAVESVRSGKKNSVKLLLLAADASANTVKRIENTGAYHKVPVIRLSVNKAELARLTGSGAELSAVGVTDTGFVEAMLKASDVAP